MKELGGLEQRISHYLHHYSMALPIITALSKSPPQGLINVLSQASQEAILAFSELTTGNLMLSPILALFLAKTSADLDKLQQDKLIDILRRPNMDERVRDVIDSLNIQAKYHKSIQLMLSLAKPFATEDERIQYQLSILTKPPLHIEAFALSALMHYYHNELPEPQLDKIKPLFIDLIIQGYTQITSTDEVLRQQIKTDLTTMDSYLFATPEQFTLAQGFHFNDPKNWISTLLTSPQLVANATIDTFANLYHRIQQVFNHQNTETFAHKSMPTPPYANTAISHMQHLQKTNQLHPQNDACLQAKNHVLQKFYSQQQMVALLADLESKCRALAPKDIATAKKALSLLYQFLALEFTDYRTDLRLQMIDYAYQEDEETSPGISRFQEWLKLYLPALSLPIYPLPINTEQLIYNSSRQTIGLLQANNLILTFVEDKPMPLLQSGCINVNEPVYDKHGKPLGHINHFGTLTPISPEQRHWSAHLLASVPALELNKSPSGLRLLLQHVLNEQSFRVLYGEDGLRVDTDKRFWLERQMAKTLSQEVRQYPYTMFQTFVETHSSEGVFFALRSMHQPQNAMHLFQAILNNDIQRNILLSGAHDADFHYFLNKLDPIRATAIFLQLYSNQPWFAIGLAKFAFYAKKHNHPQLMTQAMTLLTADVAKEPQRRQHYDNLLIQLISTEELAALLLREFYQDSFFKAIPSVDNKWMMQFIALIQKRHVVALLRKLNKTSYWEENPCYKLLLYRLFHPAPLFSAAEEPWQPDELHEFGRFISRHFQKKRAFDTHKTIGKKYLGDLVLCSANSGLISMFYHQNELNKPLASMHISLDHTDTSAWQSVTQHAKETLCLTKLPLIVVYLLSFSGEKRSILKLLRDYSNTFQQQATHLHAISNLLATAPDREISLVIFDFFIEYLHKNPHIIGSTILHDLGFFYYKTILGKTPTSPKAEVSLLTFFGKHKYYQLVEYGCLALDITINTESLRATLAKATLEARIERYLMIYLGSFFFPLIKFCLRLWYYGWDSIKNASRIVCFCDEASPGSHSHYAPEHINAAAPQQRYFTEPMLFKERKEALIKQLSHVHSSHQEKTTFDWLADTQEMFFKHAVKEQEKEYVGWTKQSVST